MVDQRGNMYLEDSEIIELMLANRSVKILPNISSHYEKFDKECKRFGIKNPFILDELSDEISWNMPDEYKNIDIRQYILDRHSLTKEQINRVDLELIEYSSRNLFDLLRFLIYFISVIKTNNIVYGVGRGSSISSYILYLIGIHRIDSFKFNLDIKEFLK